MLHQTGQLNGIRNASQGSTMIPKHLDLRHTFVKWAYLFRIWWPVIELLFPEHFRSLIDDIFQFKFRHWLFSILKRTIDSDRKVLNHILLMLANDHDTSWNLRISTLEPKPSSLFWLHTSVDVASDRPASWSVDSTRLFLAKNYVWRFCFLLILKV
jgi:hypothetical protein